MSRDACRDTRRDPRLTSRLLGAARRPSRLGASPTTSPTGSRSRTRTRSCSTRCTDASPSCPTSAPTASGCTASPAQPSAPRSSPPTPSRARRPSRARTAQGTSSSSRAPPARAPTRRATSSTRSRPPSRCADALRARAPQRSSRPRGAGVPLQRGGRDGDARSLPAHRAHRRHRRRRARSHPSPGGLDAALAAAAREQHVRAHRDTPARPPRARLESRRRLDRIVQNRAIRRRREHSRDGRRVPDRGADAAPLPVRRRRPLRRRGESGHRLSHRARLQRLRRRTLAHRALARPP